MVKNQISRGDIYYADLGNGIGSEQGRRRPVIIVQNNTGNRYSPTVIIVPMTTKLRKNYLPTHVILPKICGLRTDSLFMAEQIRTIDRTRLSECLGHIGDEHLPEIDKALAASIGISYETKSA